jgi:hypothetical protein
MEAIGLNNGMETRIEQLDGGDWIGQRDWTLDQII